MRYRGNTSEFVRVHARDRGVPARSLTVKENGSNGRRRGGTAITYLVGAQLVIDFDPGRGLGKEGMQM